MASKGSRSGQINTEVEGIGHLLSDRLLAIPDYQRSYSWEEDEVVELWEDLQKAIKRGSHEYFLGSIVTTRAGDSSKRQHVIDGQQRMATISILFTAMRDLFKDRSDERAADVERAFLGSKNMATRTLEPRLTLNADDNDFFQSLIRDASTAGPGVHKSHKRLRFTYDHMTKKLLELVEGRSPEDWQQPLVELHDFVLNDAKVIDVHVPDEDRSFVIFETLNDRGLNLNTTDLLRNHLFGTSGERIEETKHNWGLMSGALEAAGSEADSDAFLRQYRSSITGIGRVKALFSEIRDTVETEQQAVDLASSLARSAPLWSGMFDTDSDAWKDAKPAAQEALGVLRRLKVEQCRPLLLAAMRQLPPKELEALTTMILSWTVRWFVAGGGGAGVTERLYSEAAQKISSKQLTTAAAVQQHLSARIPNDEDFKRAFTALTVRRGWLARYYLHALERTKRAADGITAELVPNQDFEAVNLEHVLPKSWDSIKWPDFSGGLHEGWFLTLGNQAIMLKSENDLIGNEDFATKRPALARSAFLLTSEIGNYLTWTAQDIAERQERLAELAVKTWPISAT